MNYWLNQSNTIKAMQSTIRPEWYNQSNTISDTVRKIKTYGRQYNEDKPKGGNSCIISNIYAKVKNLRSSLILGGYKKINSRAIFDSIC